MMETRRHIASRCELGGSNPHQLILRGGKDYAIGMSDPKLNPILNVY